MRTLTSRETSLASGNGVLDFVRFSRGTQTTPALRRIPVMPVPSGVSRLLLGQETVVPLQTR